MPIALACPKCDYRFRVNDTFAQEQISCPQCATGLRVPTPKPSQPPPPPVVEESQPQGDTVAPDEAKQAVAYVSGWGLLAAALLIGIAALPFLDTPVWGLSLVIAGIAGLFAMLGLMRMAIEPLIAISEKQRAVLVEIEKRISHN